MLGIAANADKCGSSFPCSDAHESASKDVGLSSRRNRHYILDMKTCRLWADYLNEV